MHEDELSLEELSAAAGMTARNVRAYQTKGLIPPPIRRGRRSVYDSTHLERLQAINQVRRRGASLALIAAHLAEGKQLAETTLIGWDEVTAAAEPDHELSHGSGGGADPPSLSSDIAPLLAGPDGQGDALRAHTEALIKVGVLVRDGTRVDADPELARVLTLLHGDGLPVGVALGLAHRTALAALSVIEALQETVTGLDGDGALLVKELYDLADVVFRQVVRTRTAPT